MALIRMNIKRKAPGIVLWIAALLAIIPLGGCSVLRIPSMPTPFPTDYLPTAIALTVTAAHSGSAGLETPTPSPTPIPATEVAATEITATSTSVPPTPTTPVTAIPTGALPALIKRTPVITPTSNPDTPNAEIEFLGMGPLSRVTSPIRLSAYLKTWEGGRVTTELLGEDKRVLFREVRAIRGMPDGAWIPLKLDVDYEVVAAAEAGRLQISVEDSSKRIRALNSIPLILLSIGAPDLLPAQDILAPIVIQKPGKRALIQGGTLLVSGLMRGTPDQPVLVKLLNTKGVEIGSRIASVQFPPEGGYGSFQVEVSYTVSQFTDALLVVTQGEDGINDIIHLTSLDVMVAP